MPAASANDAFRTGYAAFKDGNLTAALKALGAAADQGHAGALWQLGRIYSSDSAVRDDARAYQAFSRLANMYEDADPLSPEAPFVSAAFVALGVYYLTGIPGELVADEAQARRLFSYAALYYGDAEAQYQLATMLAAGQGGRKDERQAARWLKLAAEQGHAQAQADLGRILIEGTGVRRDVIEGLKWLALAAGSAADPHIQTLRDAAFAATQEAERAAALRRAEDWRNARTPNDTPTN